MPPRFGSFVVVLAILFAAALTLRSDPAPSAEGPREPTLSVDELKQNFLAEHEIGRRFHVDPADLPPPKTGAIVTNRSLILPYNGQISYTGAERARAPSEAAGSLRQNNK